MRVRVAGSRLRGACQESTTLRHLGASMRQRNQNLRALSSCILASAPIFRGIAAKSQRYHSFARVPTAELGSL